MVPERPLPEAGHLERINAGEPFWPAVARGEEKAQPAPAA